MFFGLFETKKEKRERLRKMDIECAERTVDNHIKSGLPIFGRMIRYEDDDRTEQEQKDDWNFALALVSLRRELDIKFPIRCEKCGRVL